MNSEKIEEPMEHRHCAVRHQCDIKILIYKLNNPVAFGRIKNCSSQGVFIETEFKEIHKTQYLKLEIMPIQSDRKNTSTISLGALVIHVTKNGFGAEIDISFSDRAALFCSLFKGTDQLLGDVQEYVISANG